MKNITSSVAFQDEQGNVLANGSLILSLPPGVYLVASGGGQVYGSSVIINLDATGKVSGTVSIWASDELSPQTSYNVTFCALANGFKPVGSATWFIGGTSPIDLSLMTPSSNGPSYSGAVILNPTAQQNINGQTLNMEGASVGFSAAGSTVADAFFSRLSPAVIGVGAAAGDALGTLRAAIVQIGGSGAGFSGSAGVINAGNGTQGDKTARINAGSMVLQGTGAGTGVATFPLELAGNSANTGGIQIFAGQIGVSANESFRVDPVTSPGKVIVNNFHVQGLAGGTFNGTDTASISPTGLGTFTGGISADGTHVITLPTATDTLVGRATTDTLTNKTIGGTGLFGLTPKFQQFTASGTFTIPAGITAVKVTVTGGGGAGGGATTTANSSGTGGGPAGTAIKWLTGLTPGNTLTVTVGAGGTGVANGVGNAGGNSTVASGTQTISTITGGGGAGGAATGNVTGALAGSATGGDINLTGNNPAMMFAGFSNVGSTGGSSIWGGSGAGGWNGAGSNAAANSGSGGGGAGGGAAGTVAGGNGGSGVVVFEWVQ